MGSESIGSELTRNSACWRRDGRAICTSGFRQSMSIFTLLLLNVLHLGYAESSFANFHFTIEPKSLIVLPRSSAAFHCGVTFSHLPSAPEIIWIKDGVKLNKDVLSNGTLHFAFTSSDNSEEGVYQCRAEVKGIGAIVSRKAHLKIASDVTFTEEPQGMKLHLGDVVMMLCRVTDLPLPKVTWFRYDEELDKEDFRFVFHLDGSLEISSLKLSDFGNYRCQVEIDGKRFIQSSIVHLALDEDRATYHKVPPRFIMRPKDKLAMENSSVLLNCAANGRDRNGVQPRIAWLRNGSTIDGILNPGNRLSLVGSGSLKIVEIQEYDSGLYTCRATNMEESVDADVIVTVQVPPSIVRSPQPSTFRRVNSDVEFSCTVRGIPKPSVQWIKDGDVIVENDYLKLVDGFHLRVLGVVESDAGMYQCLATNAVGSAQAAVQLTVEPLEIVTSNVTGTPSVPTGLQVIIISTRFVTLSWTAPVDSGTSNLSGYSVSFNEESSSRERVLNTSALEAKIQDLKPSTKYYFRIAAWNSQGPSQKSAQMTVETQPEALMPDAPYNLQAIALSPTAIRVKWSSPVNTHGPIITFKVHYFPLGDSFGENDVNVLENEYTFTELRKFQKYVFRIVAYNSNGPGIATEDIVCQTYSDVPSQPPQNVSVEASTSTSIAVRWEPPPDSALNGIITGYKIRYRKQGDRIGETVTCDGVRRIFDLTDLLKGTEYSVRVQAVNSNGTGPASTWMTVETYANDLDETAVPGQPVSLRVRPMSNSIVVSWNPPKERMTMIRGFILGYGVGIPDVFRQVLDAKQRSHTIKGLTASSEYVISLKAFNNVGEGRPVYETTQTQEQTAPEEPTPVLPPVGVKAVVLSATTILMTWTDTALGRNQRVTDNRHYVVRYNPMMSGKPKMVNATDLSAYLDDLKPDTEYEFSVRIVRGQRQSIWSLSVFNRTKELAPTTAPRDLTLTQVADQPTWASLTWQPPRQMNGQVTGYLVFYTTNASQSDRDWVVEGIVGDKITMIVKELAAQTTYYFKVQARNTMGYGPMSPTVIFRTPNADGSGGGMLSIGDEQGQINVAKDMQNESSGVPLGILWTVVGIVGAVAIIAVAAVVVMVFLRRRKDLNAEQPTSLSSASKPAPGALKPPDLWIHDRLEMNRLSRNSIGSSTLTDPATLPPVDALEMEDSVSVDLQDAAVFKNRRAPGFCPMMMSVGNPPSLPRDPLGSLLPTASSSDASYSVGGIRPLFPRSQFTSPPRVNVGDIHQPVTDYSLSAPERHRTKTDNYRKLLGNGSHLTAVRPMQQQSGGLPSSIANSSPTSSPVETVAIIPQTSISKVHPIRSAGSLHSPDATICSNNSSEIAKSFSTEELTAEMANIDGLMKDLNAITQHEFRC